MARKILFTFIFVLTAVLAVEAYAEISGPIPLAPQPMAPSLEEPQQHFDFPPATEPYQPENEHQPSRHMAVPHVPEPSYAEPQFQPSHPVNEAPAEGGPVHVSREELESAAGQCYSQIEELWKQKSRIPRHNMRLFQKSIGDAKVECDALNALVRTLKRADEHVQSFQSHLQKAQTVTQ